MVYRPIPLPPDTPPMVQQVVRGAVEPLLLDVNVMLRLPQPPQTPPGVGCNLAIANVLLAVVSGVSAVLYSTRGGSGKVFQDFLVDFYPWGLEPHKTNLVTGADAARILYEEFRNPLTHSSGTPVFDVRGESRRQYIADKPRLQISRVAFDTHPDRGLPEQKLLELNADGTNRPWWLPVTLAKDEKLRVLTVESLYWGIRRAIQTLCSDSSRTAAAVQFFANGQTG